MLAAHTLRAAAGARRKPKRVGRGNASGHGTTAGRGTKGQKARSGGNIPPHFEGGQLPLVKRLPHKRGFTNIFRREYAVVNVERLGAFAAGSEVTPERLVQAGMVKSLNVPIKVLGQGSLSVSLTVVAHKFSAAARSKIEAAGGVVKEL